ncbi:MAG: DEAD/DEAH box helicase family protein [Lachnospiraceae bacterium]|nr:DEAD/DEAH box helicase family protein [Lachnospiraceae bacterium]
MNYENILCFKGIWRNYQDRVLKNTKKYVADGHIHIVAAPGSGKTTLGIELIARMGEPALVFAPSVTIREQWVARIAEGFLCDGLKPEDYISQDFKEPRCITVVTYQALHSAMKRYKGKQMSDEESDDFVAVEEVDYSDFDVVSEMKAAGVGVLCLDECHHLRSEWWKALEEFKDALGKVKIIALTATPPYDSTPAMWERYMQMCGEVDEEITIPELVKEGSLCPHQDFVYFNYPTEEEKAEIRKFQERSKTMQQKLLTDSELMEAMGISQTAGMTAGKLEQRLQSFLYDDAEMYSVEKEYREQKIDELKAAGFIDKKQVMLTANAAIEKLLMNSKAKSRSIQAIVESESRNMGEKLRMLILTDYIRKEYEQSLGDASADINALGVLPFFEQLRRALASAGKIRLGVLCGTIVIIPAEAKESLLQAVGESGKVNFSPIGQLQESDYVKVTAVGDAHFLTSAVTEVFSQGYMQVLIGTKSLLGEGWDSPCINSLILASFVGSFMLSNQMRGRAIRVWKQNPEKSSNIWHLVCLNENQEQESEDFALLKRRMEHFLGLHYTENVIESGMERLSYIEEPYTPEHITEINNQMLTLAKEREQLKSRWQQAVTKSKEMQIVDETAVSEESISKTVYKKASTKLTACGVGATALFVAAGIATGGLLTAACGLAGVVAAGAALTALPATLKYNSSRKRLRAYGEGIYRALASANLLEERNGRVTDGLSEKGEPTIYLKSGSKKDQELFAGCVTQMFADVENQRYLLVKRGNHKASDGIYCVPDCFASKKELAQGFYDCLKSAMGEYDLVYTRNEAGKKLFLALHKEGGEVFRNRSVKKTSVK